ncbi:hypothetical protein GQR58_030575 [Nymphon striatum]|nr:hypothetical protein GQR58_030575 [Nymphon striatum]
MATIDPRKTWRLAEERLDAETDPILRRNLALLVRHMKAEAYLDMDHRVRAGSLSLLGTDGSGREDWQGEFYGSIAASGMHRLHHDINRIVVDTDCIVTEGEISIAYPGALLNATRSMDLDPEASYLFATQMLIVWPIADDGLFVGEDSYSGPDGFAGIENRKLEACRHRADRRGRARYVSVAVGGDAAGPWPRPVNHGPERRYFFVLSRQPPAVLT